MSKKSLDTDKVRASRAGHTFHERWAARRALQLIFPQDDLFAIAVEGISALDISDPGEEAQDIADLVLYFGQGASFEDCNFLQTIQFKYRVSSKPVTSSYLKKTLQKFADTIVGYETEFSAELVDQKLTFSFVTNSEFSSHLWEAINCLKAGTMPKDVKAKGQFKSLKKWCDEKNIDAARLFSLTSFQASTENLPLQNRLLRRKLCDWSAGVGGLAGTRLFALAELIREKAGIEGQGSNLVRREDVLDALECDTEDLFPAETRFIQVDDVVVRPALKRVERLIDTVITPVFIHADGGVGKTVFIQNLASNLRRKYEVVVFDCFGGGAYRSEAQARHLPKVGLVQIINELASRGLCDPLLPSDSDRLGLIKAARKRLKQAQTTVSEQSDKEGVLIVLDAADNAQIEAMRRNEDAFPKLLLASLSESPLEGVKLLLTARPHRKDDVIGRCDVELFQLDSFSGSETQQFLETRRGKVSSLELSHAIARSGGNARVLEYLVESWESNVSEGVQPKQLTVENLIAQRCEKIFSDLYIAGWDDARVKEFFAALALLPPPIPIEELSNALGWPLSEVRSAASDLAPMLEVVSHGAIFRDEPTETYVSDHYSGDLDAQQSIAQRLQDSQSLSMYAAEALPRFLVAIKDSKRAFDLASSSVFPKEIQSDFGRRRLRLVRLYAAFSLAVGEKDNDRVLGLATQLAQVSAANARGDQFIRKSPALATVLGDRDATRRLFLDRSGWRGARNVRLVIAHSFLNEFDEAEIHYDRAINWINWHLRSNQGEERPDKEGPKAIDFAIVIFFSILRGRFSNADRNLSGWAFPFTQSVCSKVVSLIEQYDALTQNDVMSKLANFAASRECHSLALQVSLLSNSSMLDSAAMKRIARSVSSLMAAEKPEDDQRYFDHKKALELQLAQASFAALVTNSRQSSKRILSIWKQERPSQYDYDERYGEREAWVPVLASCLKAWSKNEVLTYHHLLPAQVSSKGAVRCIDNKGSLLSLLEGLQTIRPKRDAKGASKDERVKQFKRSESKNIADGIDLILTIARPVETFVTARGNTSSQHFKEFMAVWEANLQQDLHWRAEEPKNILARSVGLGFSLLMLQHSEFVEKIDAESLVKTVLSRGFSIQDRLSVLNLIATRRELREIAASMAKVIAEDISKDEYIEQRGDYYRNLTSCLIWMGRDEAREYYKEGLSQLDQMGGDDHDLIYSMLQYAQTQRGGFVEPRLSHRLMNLCQIIFHYEPSKFDWTLFGNAAATSIGFPAIYKQLRWSDQDIVSHSYGLPQTVCYLAKNKHLDPRRAAALLTVCKDHGWHEWQIGTGLKDILDVAAESDRQRIFKVLVRKLKAENCDGGSDFMWKSLSAAAEAYPSALLASDASEIRALETASQIKREEWNARNNSPGRLYRHRTKKDEGTERIAYEQLFQTTVENCDLASPSSIDSAVKTVREQSRIGYSTKSDLFAALRQTCDFDQRVAFTYAICEVDDFRFDEAIDLVIENIELWKETSAYLRNNAKKFVEHLFSLKGSELFDLRYTGISRQIYRLCELCKDERFVLELVLETIAKEQVELTGDEWLQVATSLCKLASPYANHRALEQLLSSSAIQAADDIGEGKYTDDFDVGSKEPELIADVFWHLLGHDDAYVRWHTARAIQNLFDLELYEDIDALFARFFSNENPALVSSESKHAFQNAQQWLLMGLCRASNSHKEGFKSLRARLEGLLKSTEIHVVHKVQIAKCLSNSAISEVQQRSANKILTDIRYPKHGYVERTDYPKHTESVSGFHFDYDFDKYAISKLARLFGISKNEATDALADEIVKQWPDAKGLDFFHGSERYRRSSSDRYENYREHIQKHALYSAATTLIDNRPIVLRNYDFSDEMAWAEWLSENDVSFDDGMWLADRKNAKPSAADQRLLGPKEKDQETLISKGELLRIVGLEGASEQSFFPIYGHWKSPDDVHVRIVSALVKRRGAVRICQDLSKREDHDLWLPTMGADGKPDDHLSKNPCDPWLWSPETYPLGIDEGDQLACRYSAARPRLGIDLTKKLGLSCDEHLSRWFDRDRNLVMQSNVWGRWEQERETQVQEDGVLLSVSREWLADALEQLGKHLVYYVTVEKYKSYNDYDRSSGAKAVFVGLKKEPLDLRVWKAGAASKAVY